MAGKDAATAVVNYFGSEGVVSAHRERACADPTGGLCEGWWCPNVAAGTSHTHQMRDFLQPTGPVLADLAASLVVFFQTATGGIVLGALFSSLATLLVFTLQGRREERVGARLTRKEAGIEALRAAYEVRDTAVNLLAADGAARQGASIPQETMDELLDRYERAGFRLGAARATARAVTSHYVAVLVIGFASESQRVIDLLESSAAERQAFQERLDLILDHLADAIADDARVRIGQHRAAPWLRLRARVNRGPENEPRRAREDAD